MSPCNSWAAPHPRDGPWAWFVCFTVMVINGLLFGYLLSFGVLLPVLSDHFGTSRGTTAWIGSIQVGFAFLCGPLVVKVIEHFGERTVTICCGLSNAAFLIISSYVENLYILYFTHGMLLGLSTCFNLNSYTIITRKYFKKNLSVAVGIVTSGSSLGVLVFGPVLQVLIDNFGWRGTLRIMTSIMFVISALGVSFDPNIEKDEQEKKLATRDIEIDAQNNKCLGMIDCSVWRSKKYIVGSISIFLTFFGLYVPNIHLVRFAKENGIPGSKSSLLFIYIGVCSAVVRVFIGRALDKGWLSSLRALQLSSFVVGTSVILLTQAKIYTHFIVFAIFIGFGNGIFVTTQCVFFLTCFADIKKAPSSFGIGLMTSSFALFLGAPTAGFIADYFQSYIPAFFVTGGIVVFAGILPCVLCFLLHTFISNSHHACPISFSNGYIPDLVIFSIFYGMADGAFRTTLNILFLDSVGVERMASAFGQANMAISVFAAAGPAVAGAIADHYDSYTLAFYIAGSITLLGSFVYCLLFCWKSKKNEHSNTRESVVSNEIVLEKSHTNHACDTQENNLVLCKNRETCPAPNKAVVNKSHTNEACDIQDTEPVSRQNRETSVEMNEPHANDHACDVQDTHL